jgi:deazaflavin-dependent oxidoreductase (nitroreductase family)
MAMNPIVIKLWSTVHAFLYGLTGGRVGATFSGAPVLLLITTGRKSGKRRTWPLVYMRDGEDIVIVASNAGNDQHPAWWLNLRDNPEAEIRIGSENKRVLAETASAEEKSRLWRLVVGMYAGFEDYQRGTDREIPVVVLRPQA